MCPCEFREGQGHELTGACLHYLPAQTPIPAMGPLLGGQDMSIFLPGLCHKLLRRTCSPSQLQLSFLSVCVQSPVLHTKYPHLWSSPHQEGEERSNEHVIYNMPHEIPQQRAFKIPPIGEMKVYSRRQTRKVSEFGVPLTWYFLPSSTP